MKTRHVVLLAGALLLASLFAGVGAPVLARGDEPRPGTVTANGVGSVAVVPDIATLAFGVTTDAQTAAGALAQNNAAAARVIAAVKSAGVAAKDVQTQSVSLSPRYTDRGNDIVGYTANNTVGAVVRNLQRVGNVIDVAVDAGATNVNGPALSRADTDALYRDALKLAVADARAKADALAQAGRFAVGKISAVVEGSSAPVPVGAKDASPGATPIEAGTQQVTAMVTVSFELS